MCSYEDDMLQDTTRSCIRNLIASTFRPLLTPKRNQPQVAKETWVLIRIRMNMLCYFPCE